MRNSKRWLSVAVLAIASYSCSGPTAVPQASQNTDTYTINPTQFHQDALANPARNVRPKQLAQWLQDKSTLLIDLRSAADYRQGHLAGAINIPLTDLTELALEHQEIGKSARIVVYCDYQLVPTQRIALTTFANPTLQQLGFKNTYTLEPLWRSAECKSVESDQPCSALLPWVSGDTD